MKRETKAFWLAPLWIPSITSLLVATRVPSSERLEIVPFVAIFSAIFAYAGAFVMGLPVYRILQRRHRSSPLAVAAAGFAIGVLTAAAALLLLSFAVGFGLRGIELAFEEPARAQITIVIMPGLLGALVGLTAWRIIHPRD